MLNAGAILSAGVAATLVEPDMTNSEKFDYIQQYFKVSNILADAGCWNFLLENQTAGKVIEEFLSHLFPLVRIFKTFL